MCISTDTRKMVTMKTVNIDSTNVHFKPELIQVCTACDCMRLTDYQKLVDRRIANNIKTSTGWAL